MQNDADYSASEYLVDLIFAAKYVWRKLLAMKTSRCTVVTNVHHVTWSSHECSQIWCSKHDPLFGLYCTSYWLAFHLLVCTYTPLLN